MDILLVPTIVFVLWFPGYTPARTLADFSRFASAQGEAVAVVDTFGVESLGKIVAASETGITLRTGTVTAAFDREQVLKADRLRDGSKDGLIKGMLFGALVSWAYNDAGVHTRYLPWVSAFGSIGLIMDFSETNRAPLYRK